MSAYMHVASIIARLELSRWQ